MFNTEPGLFTQVDPATEPVRPPAEVMVTVPLFVKIKAPDRARVPLIVKLAVEAKDLLEELSVNVPVLL